METIENIWHNMHDKLLAFILKSIPDKTTAEDILQEVFVKIHEKISSLADATKLQPWIYQITRNLIADHFRGQKKGNEKAVEKEETDDGNEGSALMEEAVQDIINFMDAMPPEHCDPLCATEIDGMSIKEYAEKTGISYTAAKSRVQRSRKMLKEMMMDCCHYQFDTYGTVISITPKSCCNNESNDK
jgi:RNA polymerase sigma-70 factor, ECF subfamily